jgi:glycopeptide antibiotics resistance protein
MKEQNMILDDEFVWLIGIPILFAVLFVLRKRGYRLSRLLFISAFWVYILLVLKATVFPIPIARGISDETEMFPLMLPLINFTPFYFGRFLTLEKIFFLLVQNIILTMPFGFGVNFIARIKTKTILWLSVAFGLGIEVIQFVIALISASLGMGITGRIVDINDAILNIAGVLLGYGLFKLFASWYTTTQHKFKDKEPFVYIHEITSRV